jgi:macrolide transport system ATP-binding/permease protein
MRFFKKFSNLLFRTRVESDLAREITAHLTLLQDDYEQHGMTAEEAKLAARRAYGGIEQAKELHRDERSFLWIEQAAQDFRYALRGLARNPGFTVIAILVLALGIGVNTALFTTYNAIALKPLPVADPEHVVRLERWVASHNLGTVQ